MDPDNKAVAGNDYFNGHSTGWQPPGLPPGTKVQHPRDGWTRSTAFQVWLGVAIAVALLAGIGVFKVNVLHESTRHSLISFSGDQLAFSNSGPQPTLSALPHTHRLLPAPLAPPGTGGYTVMTQIGTQLARWDPCVPIRYVISGKPDFPAGSQLLRGAIATISHDTGLKFLDAGATTERPTAERSAYQPSRYGDQWAPVLIAWTNSTQISQFAADAVGLGGADPYEIDGQWRLVSGLVYLNSAGLDETLGQPQGISAVQTVMLHELGHLVGLGHVPNDPNAVMYPVDHPSDGYDLGDLRGLADMGSGACPATN